MTQTVYERIDLSAVAQPAPAAPAEKASARGSGLDIRWAIIPLSALLCCVQAWVTLLATHTVSPGLNFTPTLISVIAFGALFLLVLVVNPLVSLVNWLARRGAGLRLLRPLTRAELMAIFAAMSITSGMSTFGLADQLVPIIATPYNATWATPQSGWESQLHPHLNPHLYIQDTQVIQRFREGFVELQPRDDAGWLAHRSYEWRLFAQEIPWRAWLGPLSYWMLFVLAVYAMFYSLTYTVLGYWADREKLIFPLAKLPEALLPDSDDGSRWLPSIMRTPGFWVGFAVSFLVLAYNAGTTADLFGAMQPIQLGMSAVRVTDLLYGTIFEGVTGSGAGLRMMVIFTCIGIAFLLPLEISFSIWFYYLLSRVLILCMVWIGYGQDTRSFPTEWLWVQNGITAQGAGGLMLFSAVSLYRCVREYIVLGAGRSFAERARLAIPVVGLVLSMVAMTLWISWNGLNLLWAGVFVLFVTLLTLGIMRTTAEGGVYWYQAHASFFHFYKMLGLGAYLKPVLLGPLLPIYWVLFLDIKTFMAPNLANAAKLHKDVGGSRLKFHLNIVVSVLVTIVVSLAYSILLAYSRGADRMNSWFYSGGPSATMTRAYRATTTVPQFDPVIFSWFTFGAGWVALSMILRRSLFWFPHPIGYVMLMNPLMNMLWFSFFIGWIFKKLVVKYGGKPTFDRTRIIFIGFILGELLAILAAGIVTLTTNLFITGITLNRHG